MLTEKIETIIREDKRLDGAIVGMHVTCAETGKTLYNRLENIRLHPASNMKLLSGAAALQRFGEKYTFTTSIGYDGMLTNGVLEGNIYIKGEGDPTLLPRDIESFAQQVKHAGVSTIRGNIIVDDFHYDDVRLSPDMVWSDQPYYYGSQVSALTLSPDEDYDTGTVLLTVEAAETVGDKPSITCYPQTTYVHITNDAVTGEKIDEPLEESELILNRIHGTNEIVLSGSIPLKGETEKIWVSVWEPSLYVGTLLKEALENIEVDVKGKVTRQKMGDDAQVIDKKASIPLKEIMIPFMKLSNNGHGEMFVKELGKIEKGIGSWEEGIDVMKDQLREFGVDPDLVDLRDGSGLSQATTVPAKVFTTFLYHVQSAPWFPHFFHSLPIGGEEDRMKSGTLHERLKGIDVQAKTGTISGVSTLSGYVTTRAGKKRIFSILLNNIHERDEEHIKDIEDALVTCIANGE